MKYTIISDDNLENFEKAIKNKLTAGWTLVGGIFVSYLSNGQVRYHQAITKTE
jgi:hypothetical protein